MSEKIFGVAGSPIGHSRSPFIFNSLFRELGIEACYTRLAVSNALEAKRMAASLNLSGLNVTSPLKENLVDLLDKIDFHASKIGAVNTVVRLNNNTWAGFNTDYSGVVDALKANGVNPRGRSIFVIGAGGAARAAVYAMKLSRVKKITLANRTEVRARSLAQEMGCQHVPVRRLADLIGDNDIVISCIPHFPDWLKKVSILKNMVVLEAQYGETCSRQKKKAADGVIFISGLDWLFYQAVSAFRIFTGQKVPSEVQKKIFRNLSDSEKTKKLHIALIGFMGAGKSTVGPILADDRGYAFVDTDLFLERQTGLTVPEIFRVRGEKNFRRLETSLIRTAFLDGRPKVIAVGGGAVLDEENRAIIRKNCTVIWLWAPVAESIKRINLRTRPLLRSSDPLKKAESLMDSRKSLYARMADVVINTEEGTPRNTLRRIKDEMDKAC